MAKQNKENKDAAINPETDVVVQTDTTTEIGNQNETPAIQDGAETPTGEKIGSTETENIEDTELDSKGEAETTGAQGTETDNQIEDNSVLTEDQLPAHPHPEPKVVVHDENGVHIETPDEKRERIAASIFEKNHRKTVLYFTSNMTPFFVKSDALRHANSLDNKVVVTVNKK